MADLQHTLTALLGGDMGAAQKTPMRLVRKNGRPFLLLPQNARLAAATLALYPAQSLRARIARQGLRIALAAGLSARTERLSLPVSSASLFVRFLTISSGGPDTSIPTFGVLAGNPAAPGQRFIFLLFNGNGIPTVVVKAGISEDAKKLIRREREFLAAVPNLSGIPRLRNHFDFPNAQAIAMDFIDGRSPGPKDELQIQRVLTSWILPDHNILVSRTRVWNELESAAASKPLFNVLSKKLGGKSVGAAIFHGDFAPWNIKVTPGETWMVLDWERGDTTGLPGYDWFHFLIQSRLLVAHEPAESVIRELEALIGSADFQSYSTKAHISGIERELVILYLLHHNEVIRPAEGLIEGNELLSALVARWLKV